MGSLTQEQTEIIGVLKELLNEEKREDIKKTNITEVTILS